MSIFLDTGFYFALISKKDRFHKRAQEILLELAEGVHGKIFTSDLVFNESMTLINIRTNGMKKDLLKKMSSLFIGQKFLAILLRVQRDWFEDIVQMQIKMTKKNNPISFVDSSNIISCKKNKISKIVSFDSHYKSILTQIQ
ncbi:MAG: type II toxin-antitoxin system VapC family toxin [Candidatus Helarchaeota archaeon]